MDPVQLLVMTAVVVMKVSGVAARPQVSVSLTSWFQVIFRGNADFLPQDSGFGENKESGIRLRSKT